MARLDAVYMRPTLHHFQDIPFELDSGKDGSLQVQPYRKVPGALVYGIAVDMRSLDGERRVCCKHVGSDSQVLQAHAST